MGHKWLLINPREKSRKYITAKRPETPTFG